MNEIFNCSQCGSDLKVQLKMKNALGDTRRIVLFPCEKCTAGRDEAVKKIAEITEYVRYANMETENDNAVLLAVFNDLVSFLEKKAKP